MPSICCLFSVVNSAFLPRLSERANKRPFNQKSGRKGRGDIPRREDFFSSCERRFFGWKGRSECNGRRKRKVCADGSVVVREGRENSRGDNWAKERGKRKRVVVVGRRRDSVTRKQPTFVCSALREGEGDGPRRRGSMEGLFSRSLLTNRSRVREKEVRCCFS